MGESSYSANIYEYKKERGNKDNLAGTVVDIETIGEWGDGEDRYKNLRQTLLGYIDSTYVHILCALNEEGIIELENISKEIILNLSEPMYALQCEFEQMVWYHRLGIVVVFEGELQKYKYESKKEACQSLRINDYGDPFNGNGLKCKEAWLKGQFKQCIAHNRACLLKERDILIKRGFREPFDSLLPIVFNAER